MGGCKYRIYNSVLGRVVDFVFNTHQEIQVLQHLRTQWDPGDWMGHPTKSRDPCHSSCGTIKIPPCSNAIGAEQMPKFCSPAPVKDL